MDSDLKKYLVGLCAALGATEVNLKQSSTTGATNAAGENINDNNNNATLDEVQEYVLGDEAIDCLRDLKRVLRRDDKTSDKLVFRLLGEWNFLLQDLLPILHQHNGNSRLMDAVVELLVPLTWPVEYGSPAFVDLSRIQQEQYRPHLITESNFKILLDLIIEPLVKPVRDRLPRDSDRVRMILLLMRNCILIDNAAVDSTQSASIVEALSRSHLLDLLVTMAGTASDTGNCEWNTVLLEISCLLLAAHDVEQLFEGSSGPVPIIPLSRSSSSAPAVNKHTNGRHSRFRGVLTVKSGSSTSIISTTVGNKIGGSSLPTQEAAGKRRRKKARTKLDVSEQKTVSVATTTNPVARRIIRQFASDFLSNGVNVLLKSVYDQIIRESNDISSEDQLHFYRLLSFLLSFARIAWKQEDSNTSPESIATLLTKEVLGAMMRRMDMFYDEKALPLLRASITTLKAYIMILEDLSREGNLASHMELAQNIMDGLFFEKEYLEIMVRLSKSPPVMHVKFLVEVVETSSLFLRLLEKYSKNKGVLLLRKKKTVRATGSNDLDSDTEHQTQYNETAMQFENVVRMYACDSAVFMFMNLLESHSILDDDAIRSVVKLIHRIFVDVKMEALFFKLDYLITFQQILSGDIVKRVSSPARKDLDRTVRYILKVFFAKMAEYPMLCVEVLYPKSMKSDLRVIQHGLDSLTTNELDKDRAKPALQEIEVLKKLNWNEQAGVLVGMLVADAKSVWIGEISTLLVAAFSIEPPVEESQEDEKDATPVQKFAMFENEAEPIAQNKYARALLRHIGLSVAFDADITEAEPQLTKWLFEADITEDILNDRLDMVKSYLDEPYEPEDGQSLALLIKTKKNKKPRVPRQRATESSNEPVESPKESANALSEMFIQEEDESSDDETATELYRRRMELRQDALKAVEMRLNIDDIDHFERDEEATQNQNGDDNSDSEGE